MKVNLFCVLAILCSPFFQISASAEPAIPKNIIMVIADGMGPVYPTAYRYFVNNGETRPIAKTVFDRHYVGSASTYPATSSGFVTDSAASATALASGIKTYNGAIGIDEQKRPVESMLEKAKKLGYKTGVVVTSEIIHATPAAYLAHNKSRKNYNEIADSYIDEKINKTFKADILLGGGTHYFIRQDRNLVNEFKQAGGFYLDNFEQLNQLPKNKNVLGLFASKGLPAHLDDKNQYRLRTMTQAAIKHLKNEHGYFLLIEASQIDWAGHDNNLASAMAEMDDLAKTLEYLESYVANNQDTLVVITADHSTGEPTLGINDKYLWSPQVLHLLTASTETIAEKLVSGFMQHKQWDQKLTEVLLGFSLTTNEISELEQVFSLNAAITNNKLSKKTIKAFNLEVTKTINQIIDQRANTHWATTGHSAIDVPVYAMGVNKELFFGHQDNIEIAEKLFSLLRKTINEIDN